MQYENNNNIVSGRQYPLPPFNGIERVYSQPRNEPDRLIEKTSNTSITVKASGSFDISGRSLLIATAFNDDSGAVNGAVGATGSAYEISFDDLPGFIPFTTFSSWQPSIPGQVAGQSYMFLRGFPFNRVNVRKLIDGLDWIRLVSFGNDNVDFTMK